MPPGPTLGITSANPADNHDVARKAMSGIGKPQIRGISKPQSGKAASAPTRHRETTPTLEYLRDLVDETLTRLGSAGKHLCLWPGIRLCDRNDAPARGPYALQDENHLQLARALIDNTALQPLDWDSHAARIERICRLSRQEMDTLSNSLNRGNIRPDILVTPGTLIKPGLPIQTMSRPYVAKLDRWAGNPVIIYALPVYPDAGVPPDFQSTVTAHRRFTGHVRSVKSNEAFTQAFNAGRSGRSRAEDLDALTTAIDANPGFHLKDKSRPMIRGGFETSHQLADWAAQQTQDAPHGLPHNEVLTRLWPWDITQVCVGYHAPDCSPAEQQARWVEALSTANTLASSRLSLALQLCETGAGKGIEHPVFLDYLSHQLSQTHDWTASPQGNPDPLPRQEVKQQIARLDAPTRQAMLESLVTQLTKAIHVSQYVPGLSSFQPLPNSLPLSSEATQSLNQQLKQHLETL